MTNHPEIQRKLRAHLLDRLPQLLDRAPTFDDLTTSNVPYLEAVIHETLRLSRTTPGYTREGESESLRKSSHKSPSGPR